MQTAVKESIEEVQRKTSAKTQLTQRGWFRGHSPTTSCSRAPVIEHCHWLKTFKGASCHSLTVSPNSCNLYMNWSCVFIYLFYLDLTCVCWDYSLNYQIVFIRAVAFKLMKWPMRLSLLCKESMGYWNRLLLLHLFHWQQKYKNTIHVGLNYCQLFSANFLGNKLPLISVNINYFQ